MEQAPGFPTRGIRLNHRQKARARKENAMDPAAVLISGISAHQRRPDVRAAAAHSAPGRHAAWLLHTLGPSWSAALPTCSLRRPGERLVPPGRPVMIDCPERAYVYAGEPLRPSTLSDRGHRPRDQAIAW